MCTELSTLGLQRQLLRIVISALLHLGQGLLLCLQRLLTELLTLPGVLADLLQHLPMLRLQLLRLRLTVVYLAIEPLQLAVQRLQLSGRLTGSQLL
jgi:hypothetical protein